MSAAPFTVGCVQTTAGLDVLPSVEAACDGVRDARKRGADLILLPESVNIIDLNKTRLLKKLDFEQDNPALSAFRDVAVETGAWILVGSIILKIAEDRLANRSFLINGQGEIISRYDKLHMFDATLGDGENYRESALYEAGDKAVIADTPWGGLGMAICYDLRFPHLFRALAQGGAKFLALAAAFTRPTGEAHWHCLLRARAIENGCYVHACGQCGEHEGGRKTYGHSLIIDPWGEILADAGTEVGVVTARVDPAAVEAARAKIPSLAHDRAFAGP